MNLKRSVGQLMLLIYFGAISTSVQAAHKTTGKATVYANCLHGKRTASGAIYSKNKLSAASNRFPLGSKVIVKNRKTGKTATLKVNDRLARHSTAAVDLSAAAAKKLGIHGTGQIEAKAVK